MKASTLEYIKVASMAVIAISLAVMAFNMANQITLLEEIRESLNLISIRITELNLR